MMSHSCRLQGEGKVKGEQEQSEAGGKAAVTNQPPSHRCVATTGFSTVLHTYIFNFPWINPGDKEELENSHAMLDIAA